MTQQRKPLNERDLLIATYTAQGKAAKEIGALLDLPTRTIEGRLAVIRKKYNASNNIHAIVLLMNQGLIKTA